jgi:hypothetical protein
VRSLVVTSTAALLVGVLGAAPADAHPGHEPVARAAAATTLGQSGPNLAVCSTPTVPAGVLLGAQGAGGASYVATSSGVLTSFTHVANSTAGQVQAIVLADGPATNHKLVAAKSLKVSVTPGTTNTFPIRLPIAAGQRLGLGYTVSGMACAEVGVAGDRLKGAAPFDADVTNDFVYATTVDNFRPNISAVLEPDADNDGYGDLSQDACPQSALTQMACPAPQTTITKKPKRVRANPRVKVRFVSSVVGSTFQCSIDGRRFKACTSPYRKRFKVGHHKLRIRAVSPFGIAEPKPAKVTFTIV